MFKIFLVTLYIGFKVVESAQAPLLPVSFRVAFEETTFDQDGFKHQIGGQLYYDSINNRERVDRANGRYDMFCSSIIPGASTPCTQIVTQNKRYIIFPQKNTCCFCCDAEHGCGILKRDWALDAQFLGVERILDTNYNKWSKDGSFGYNHYWTTIEDSPKPKRLDEAGVHITDYLEYTFEEKTFDSSYFSLPNYCKDQVCPSTSICGKLRDSQEIM